MHVSGVNGAAAQVAKLLQSPARPAGEVQNQQQHHAVDKPGQFDAQALPKEEGKGQKLDIRV